MKSLVLAAAVVALTVPSAASAAAVAFASDRDGDYEIYAIRSNGTRLRQLTENRSFDSQPACSPDGRRVAFLSERDGDEELYVMRADGSRVRQVTHNSVADELPAWSPGGRRPHQHRRGLRDACGRQLPLVVAGRGDDPLLQQP